jgi:hypothetical protein
MPNFEYCTIQDLRDEGITTDECTDERALRLIRIASAKINAFTGQYFIPVTGDQYVDGQNSRMVWLPNFIPIQKLTAIAILSNKTARVGPHYLPDRRLYDIALTDVELARSNRVVEIIADVNECLQDYPFRWYYNELEEIWFPEGRRNVKLTGVFGWLEDEKDVESTVVGDWPEKSKKIVIDDASGWGEGDLIVFEDGSYQIVTGVKKSTNELFFQNDPYKLRTAVNDGDQVYNYGRTPLLIRRCAIKLTHLMTPKLGDSSGQDDVISQAIVSERTDNYSYRLDPSLLRERIEAGVGSTGDSEVDALLTQMIDEIPVYIGFA